jgi:hypothetical protein
MRDHSNDWLKEESSESMRITDLENRVMELELLVEKLEQRLTMLAPDKGQAAVNSSNSVGSAPCA